METKDPAEHGGGQVQNMKSNLVLKSKNSELMLCDPHWPREKGEITLKSGGYRKVIKLWNDFQKG